MLDRGLCALWTDGELAISRDLFCTAHTQAERAGDREALAVAALGYAGLWVHEHRDTTTATLLEARLRTAAELTDPLTPLGIRLRCRIAAETDYRNGEAAGVLAALDAARACGDLVAIAEGLSLAHHCLLGPAHAAQRLELSRELMAIGFRTGRRGDILMGLMWHTADLFLAADPHAERRLAELRHKTALKGYAAARFVTDAMKVMLAIRCGNFDAAERMADICAAKGQTAGDADAVGWHGAHLIAIRWYQGRLTELVPMLRLAIDSPALSTVDNSYLAALCAALAVRGDRLEAAALLARLRGNSLADLPQSSSWLITMYGIVEASALLGDAAVAAEAYNLLAPHRDLPMMAGLGVACFGSVEHALGVACLTTDEAPRAAEHFRRAVQRNLAIGHLPAAALSRSRLAQAQALPPQRARDLVQGRRHGDRWELKLGRRQAVVGDSLGMAYLARLLAHPGLEVPAVELAGAPASAQSTQELLDNTAKRAYRDRLRALDARVEEAEDRGDTAAAEIARSERQWLLDELAAATGLAGRDRRFQDNPERARVAVGKAIRRALAHIERADPVIGDELRSSVRTGVRCSYQPPNTAENSTHHGGAR
ncbi:hypothetical protein Rhe02_73330 [Rhizocola hellebori]|uniref:Uncharacterized protein n=2 Tax=Rhizocola hellebori TaxID=1392758 RepID=A0A8J3VKP2_9ACTN|nr:hypothetical protein Rhe02_73330 [Rhizocola hellebori]